MLTWNVWDPSPRMIWQEEFSSTCPWGLQMTSLWREEGNARDNEEYNIRDGEKVGHNLQVTFCIHGWFTIFTAEKAPMT